MQITLKTVSIRELADGYSDKGIDGVTGYGGKLDIRPPYQREFVYRDEKRDRVIETVLKGFPLNVMYWAKADYSSVPTDASRNVPEFEVLDGQQRTISICQYIKGLFSVGRMFFHNQPRDIQEKILNYELTIYVCEGEESEKLDWFRIINIAGEPLTPQELRNAAYRGPWVLDAKRYFSRQGYGAYEDALKYTRANTRRQEVLETAIKWAKEEGQTIEDYMGARQDKDNAADLWQAWCNVISWVKRIFPDYHGDMKAVDWGRLYRLYHTESWDAAALSAEIKKLRADPDVTNKAGIYEYVLSRDPRHLHLRDFDLAVKRAVYDQQGGKCAWRKCAKPGHVFAFEEMHADHITPWSRGGSTLPSNCQLLCADCNRRKSDV
ncbi:GmrSD restriction endonuclease domain-containing protein [Azohydromonas sediminis]|uniref:GmrSD restriction endonuclease domain-containing protein n=1 Tax=Azohydromonas sediminis TaxID=2259674 RepID=UPI000E64BFC6|nr:DUF262 domain-containing protein [Azohydromonas sediminis]